MWYCYIKPNRHVHSSGFRCFEVGYCTLDGNNKVDKKIILNTYSDCVHLYDLMGSYIDKGIYEVKIDLTKDGYLRLFGSKNNFKWRDLVMSDAILEPGSIDEKQCEEIWKKQQGDKNE